MGLHPACTGLGGTSMSKGLGGFARAAAVGAICLAAVSAVGAVTGGNDFYQVAVENIPAGVGVGVYTVTTGPLHPIVGVLGPQNVLFGGGVPSTSYTTIRSYTSGTDYTQRSGLTLGGGAPPTFLLEGFVAAGEEAIPVGNPLDPSGFMTIYRPGTVAPAPDNLAIKQTASAVGATFNTSAVMLKTEITNNGVGAALVGVRYLWDFQIGPNDDGPAFRQKGPDGGPLPTDTDHFVPGFTSFEVQDDNDPGLCFGVGNSPFPFFAVQGSVTGPATLLPTPPTRLTYLSWPDASGLAGKFGPLIPAASAFTYSTLGVDVSTCLISLDDTGVAYWWGDTSSNALVIPPGGTVSVAAFIYAYLPGSPPSFPPADTEGPPGDPTCSDLIDNDGDGLVDDLDPDCVPPPGMEGPPGDPTCSDTIDNDGDGLVDGDDPDCVVVGNQPPDCSAAAPDPASLWPPNHKMRRIAIGGVSDPDGDPVAITVTAIAQDEPLNALADGNTCPDADGVGTGAARVRVERAGNGDGRVYHISFSADDGSGGTCEGSVSVCVPHDRGRHRVCVDQGPLVDSTGACPGLPRNRHK